MWWQMSWLGLEVWRVGRGFRQGLVEEEFQIACQLPVATNALRLCCIVTSRAIQTMLLLQLLGEDPNITFTINNTYHANPTLGIGTKLLAYKHHVP